MASLVSCLSIVVTLSSAYALQTHPSSRLAGSKSHREFKEEHEKPRALPSGIQLPQSTVLSTVTREIVIEQDPLSLYLHLRRGVGNATEDCLQGRRRGLHEGEGAGARLTDVPASPNQHQHRRALRRRKGRFSNCNLWVNQKGENGAYTRIQDAIDAAGSGPSKICVMGGDYYETLHVKPGQNYITIEGAGKNTYISGGSTRTQYPGGRTFYAATLVVEGDYFTGRRFRIENPAKSTWDPSPAITVIGQRSTWQSIAAHAWIDTIGTFTSKHVFRRCYITGLADIIWGFGRVALVKSTVFVKYYYDPQVKYIGYITAMGTDWPSNGVEAGAVFQDCRVEGQAMAYLGRPYRPEVTVAYIDSYIGPVVPPQVWSDFNGLAQQGQVSFLLINCDGPGSHSSSVQIGGTANSAPDYLMPDTFLI